MVNRLHRLVFEGENLSSVWLVLLLCRHTSIIPQEPREEKTWKHCFKSRHLVCFEDRITPCKWYWIEFHGAFAWKCGGRSIQTWDLMASLNYDRCSKIPGFLCIKGTMDLYLFIYLFHFLSLIRNLYTKGLIPNLNHWWFIGCDKVFYDFII